MIGVFNSSSVKADKRSGASYLQRAQDLLGDPSTYVSQTSDPRECIAASYHRRPVELASSLSEANLYQRFKVIDPRLLHFNGLPKTHKPAVPLRPIICSRGSVTYPLYVLTDAVSHCPSWYLLSC